MNDERHDLTPAEKAEFASLPRERTPGRLLEERTVRALRRRGLLQGSRFRPSGLFAAAAAAVAVFVSGFAAGQWTTARSVTHSLIEAQQQTAIEAARTVQRTGSAYVTSIAALAQLTDSTGNPALAQGQEAAVAALYNAAAELARLVPNDPMAQLLRRVLQGRHTDTTEQIGARNVVWF
ncbi:MAG TPA: hypothetical protein VGA37_00660 [Gemmatimonadales bacterium]